MDDLERLAAAGFSANEIEAHFKKPNPAPKFDLTGEQAVQAKKLYEGGFSEEEIATHFSKPSKPTAQAQPSKWKEIGGETPEQRAEKYGEIKTRTWKDEIKNVGAQIYEHGIRPGLEMAGMTGGAAAGATAGTFGGGPVGTAVGGAVGAGLGYAGVKQGLNLGEQAVGYRRPEPKTAGQAVKETIGNIAEGAGYEMQGGIFGKALTVGTSKALGLNKTLTKEGQETLDLLTKRGVRPLPSELNPTKTRALFEKVLAYTPVSGDVFYKESMSRLENSLATAKNIIGKKTPDQTVEQVGNRVRKEATALLEKYTSKKSDEINTVVNDLLDTYGVNTRSEAGKDFSEILTKNKDKIKKQAQNLYDQTETMLPQKGKDIVPMSPETSTAFNKLLKEELSNPVPTKRNSGVIKTLQTLLGKSGKEELPEGVSQRMLDKDPKLAALVDQMSKPDVSWEGLKKLRTSLMESSDAIKRVKLKNTEATRAYDMISQAIDKDMESFAKGKGGKIWETYSGARATWKEMEQTFNPELLKLMNKKPEEILSNIIRSKDKGLTMLRQIKQAGGEEAVAPLRKALFQQQIRDATVNGYINPAKLEKIVNAMGPEMKAEFITPGQQKIFDNIIGKGKRLLNAKADYKTLEFLDTLAGDSNSQIVNSIVRPENITNIRLAKKLLSPARIKEIEAEVLENKIFSTGASGHVLPVTSAKNLNRYRTVLKELMPKDRFNALSDFVRSESRSDRLEKLALNASGTAQILIGEGIYSRYMKGVLDILTMHPIKGASAIARETAQLGMNKIVAKMYTSETAFRYFSGAMKMPPNSPVAISNLVKAIGIIAHEDHQGGANDNQQ